MAEKRVPTPDQQKVIDTTDRTVLLSAAAGSGKTATLTERLIKMITRAEDPLDVTRMLVVTFTRAAAEELRVRISDALAKAVAERPDDKRLAKQLLLLPTARIRTIDAFCNDLVRGHTEALGISPLYRIADEAECDLLGISLFDEVIEEAYSGALAADGLDIALIVEVAESVKTSGSLAEMLYKLYKHELHGRINGVERLLAGAECFEKEAALPFFSTRAGKALAQHYKDTALHTRALLEAAANNLLLRFGKDNIIFNRFSKKFNYLVSTCNLIAEATEDSYAALKGVKADYKLPGGSSPSEYDFSEEELLFRDVVSDAGKAVKALLDSIVWDDDSLAYAHHTSGRISLSLYRLFSTFEARFLEEKKRRAFFDFSDITFFAYSLLLDKDAKPTALAHEMKGAFDSVCIDEYQDVNEVQHRIFEAISTPRSLFMVGDIKQSIYAFRGGLPDIFARLRSTFPPLEANADRAVLFLKQNFRSEEPVISYANGVFDFLFPIIKDAIGYVPEDRLETAKAAGAVPVPTFYFMEKASKAKGEAEDDEEDEDADLPTEDDLITQKVLSLLKTGKKKDGTPVRPSDIAILSREYPFDLVEKLKAKGVPLKTKDKTDFFAHREILLALALCHAVNNPHKDVYLAGLLRSPLYRLSMEELLQVRDASRGSLYDALRAYAEANPENEKVARVLFDLARFRAMAENTPSHRLIRTMFTEVGIYAALGASERANLRRFYELARNYEGSSFRGLYRFLSLIRDMTEHGGGMPERIVGDDESVTVSTIHASKGLEYPICILAHTGKNLKKAPKGAFFFSDELGVVSAIPSEDGLAILKTPLLAAHNVIRKKSEMEEAVRVLYVALTRPKEGLYVFSCPSQKNSDTLLHEADCLRLFPSVPALFTYSSYAVWLMASRYGKEQLSRFVTLAPPYFFDDEAPLIPEASAPDMADTPLTNAEDETDYTALYRARFAFRYPHENEARLPAKLSVSALYPGVLDDITERSPFDTPTPTVAEEYDEDAEDTEPLSAPAFLSGTEENAAAKAGTATHLFLQFCDFDRILTTNGCQTKNIEEELTRLCARGFLSAEDAARVRTGELSRFPTSDLADILRSAKELHREFRFHAMLPAETFSLADKEGFAGLSVFAQGVIDLLVRCADGSLLLVDYKTDRIPKDMTDEEAGALLFARHGTQLKVYASAVEKIFGTLPQTAIYSLPKGKLLLEKP